MNREFPTSHLYRNHQFINAASDGVSISDMDSNYWSARYIGAKRVM